MDYWHQNPDVLKEIDQLVGSVQQNRPASIFACRIIRIATAVVPSLPSRTPFVSSASAQEVCEPRDASTTVFDEASVDLMSSLVTSPTTDVLNGVVQGLEKALKHLCQESSVSQSALYNFQRGLEALLRETSNQLNKSPDGRRLSTSPAVRRASAGINNFVVVDGRPDSEPPSPTSSRGAKSTREFVGSYELTTCLSSSASVAVYEAAPPSSSDPLLIAKAHWNTSISDDGVICASMLPLYEKRDREVAALSSIRGCPALPCVVDLLETDSRTFILQERYGDPLSELPPRFGINRETWQIMVWVIHALQSLEAAGFNHLGVCPANILWRDCLRMATGDPSGTHHAPNATCADPDDFLKASECNCAIVLTGVNALKVYNPLDVWRLSEALPAGAGLRRRSLADVRVPAGISKLHAGPLAPLLFAAPEMFRDESSLHGPTADAWSAGALCHWLVTGQYLRAASSLTEAEAVGRQEFHYEPPANIPAHVENLLTGLLAPAASRMSLAEASQRLRQSPWE